MASHQPRCVRVPVRALGSATASLVSSAWVANRRKWDQLVDAGKEIEGAGKRPVTHATVQRVPASRPVASRTTANCCSTTESDSTFHCEPWCAAVTSKVPGVLP